MSVLATPDDLATFLGITGNIDTDRAQLLLDLAEGEASAIVTPLPMNAKSVVLTAAARAYANPEMVNSSSVGSVSASFGSGGLYLMRNERRTLERMAGIGAGAFTVNPAPNAGVDYRDPLRSPALEDIEEFTLDYPDLIDEP
jgi:hypothetical protein